ncbi:sugar transporter ERD6-like 5 [Mangifera indica]|uniref:sugar transporter ERD6-like 5 n=1 Tax=Mangifera indica TaxID=29780 RepID=UPI001CF9FC7F|nr:sugar transporter ERD6-like 5 [Mangifera indica]XP_044483762.1 sugar transporter ERD6-like 5 [Mangifera indica]
MAEGLLTSSFIMKSGVSIHSFHSEPLLPDEPSGPVTSKLIFSSVVAVCGSYVYGHAVGYSSPAESGIVDDLGLTTAQYAVFSSILTIGAMLGAVISGRIADFIGRRWAMGISELICIAGWVLMIFAKDATWLDLGRFILGCGIGLTSYCVPIYVAEISPKHVRGAFTALNPLFMGLGQSLAFLFGSIVNWQILAFIGIVPGLIQLPCLFFIPESPRWLANIGKMKEFEDSLQRLRGPDADVAPEAAEIKEYTEYLTQMSEGGFFNMFQRKYLYTLIVGVGLIVFQRFGGLYAFVFYASTIFEDAGFPSKIGTIAASVVQIVTTVLGILLIDKAGRRPMLLISTVGSCFGCFITGSAYLFKDLGAERELTASLALIGVLVYLGLLQLGLGGIPWIIMSEIFPINIKGPAGSLVVLVSWLGSWLVSYTFSYLFDWSQSGVFFIYGGICALGVLFIAKLVPETKGRTLEEIQESMMNGSH